VEATSSGFNPTNTVIPLPGMQDPRTIAAALTSQLVTYLPTVRNGMHLNTTPK